jgi:hypothetical protein
VAVHEQFDPVEMLKVLVLDVDGAVRLEGLSVYVHGCGGTTVSSTGTVSN